MDLYHWPFLNVFSTQEDEVDRLTTLLDEEGDGRVSYRSLLGMLVNHLGDWAKRLPEVRLPSTYCTGSCFGALKPYLSGASFIAGCPHAHGREQSDTM